MFAKRKIVFNPLRASRPTNCPSPPMCPIKQRQKRLTLSSAKVKDWLTLNFRSRSSMEWTAIGPFYTMIWSLLSPPSLALLPLVVVNNSKSEARETWDRYVWLETDMCDWRQGTLNRRCDRRRDSGDRRRERSSLMSYPKNFVLIIYRKRVNLSNY